MKAVNFKGLRLQRQLLTAGNLRPDWRGFHRELRRLLLLMFQRPGLLMMIIADSSTGSGH
ncbi:MAG: hypothetical protein IJL18_03400 [Synergistaceae bacterium]|nr:hypothetical protein [Synergistaceae bacterium]